MTAINKKKVVKTKKAPAYQPDEEYLHNYITAEVAIQIEGKRKEIKQDIDTAVMLGLRGKEKKEHETKCHPLTCESKKEHYFSHWSVIWAFVAGYWTSIIVKLITILWSL